MWFYELNKDAGTELKENAGLRLNIKFRPKAICSKSAIPASMKTASEETRFLNPAFPVDTLLFPCQILRRLRGSRLRPKLWRDTITFNLPSLHPIIGEKISIRVNGIDTPEIKGKCEKEKYDAQQAQQMVADILKDAEQIVLRNMERGKYFRIAADVIIDGESLGDMLIEASGDGQRIEGESTLSLYFILGELDGTCNFFY